jgi:Phospholipase_D-nuclease N-terminal
VFCVLDALLTPEPAVRTLPKFGWVLIVLFFPLIGSVAWLVAGRPHDRAPADLPYKGNRGRVTWPATKTAGFPEYERPRRAAAPDDDPAFLDRLRLEKERSEAEHEELLRRWEADLRRREEELRRSAASGGPARPETRPQDRAETRPEDRPETPPENRPPARPDEPRDEAQ